MQQIVNMKYISVIVLLILSSCGPKESDTCHKSISFVNNSEKRLYILRSNDTILNQYTPNPIDQFQSLISPYSINNESLKNLTSGSYSCYEGSFKYYSQLVVFVFDAEVIENNSWEYVKENYLVSKRFDLTLSDLQARNWVLYSVE
jgi:hypothetical protein